MSMQGFTAEASLSKAQQRYILGPGAPAETGSVLPQCQCITSCRFVEHNCITICHGCGPFGGPPVRPPTPL